MSGAGAWRLGRRALLGASLASLSGCGLGNYWFGATAKRLPGKRYPVLSAGGGLVADEQAPVVLPAAVRNPSWTQPGGNAAHVMGHLAASPAPRLAWRASIGAGGGYRRQITAQPVVAGGHVFTMDSGGRVAAFDLASGDVLWRFNSRPRHDRSFNIGGGVAIDGATLYAATGYGEILALAAATGKPLWRHPLPAPARGAPAFAGGRLYVATLDGRLVAVAAKDGTLAWDYRAESSPIGLIGSVAPAIAGGLVVAGFASGAVDALHEGSGDAAWTASLARGSVRKNLTDVASIVALPVIAGERVFAISAGGGMVSLDLPSGRRLWSRQVSGQQTPWLAGEWLFLVSDQQRLAALSRTTGQVRWVTQLPRFRNEKQGIGPLVWMGPVLAGGRLLLAGTNREWVSVDPLSGAIVGRERLPAPAAVAPVVAAGTVLMVADDGALLALR